MTDETLLPINREGYSLVTVVAKGEIQVSFTGNGDMDTAPTLNEFLKKLHTEASQLSVRRVVFDFRELYFLNSSCLKCFAHWVGVVNKCPPEAAYGIRFLSTSKRRWQLRSLEALRNFAPAIITVIDMDAVA
jgi:hypothetical protein